MSRSNIPITDTSILVELRVCCKNSSPEKSREENGRETLHIGWRIKICKGRSLKSSRRMRRSSYRLRNRIIKRGKGSDLYSKYIIVRDFSKSS